MKYLLCVYLVYVSSFVVAQEELSPITKFLIRKGYTFPESAKKDSTQAKIKQWPDTLYYNTSYKSKLLGSLTIPFFFNAIEIAPGNRFSVNPTVNIGFGYTWFWGSFIFNENDKITIDPKVYFGVMANTGLQNGLNFKEGGVFSGGFIGVGSFTLIFGYDAVNKTPSLGFGGRVDFYTISQKYLHIIGRVHELRKHKKIAFPISYE
jgi:hypothetical protein